MPGIETYKEIYAVLDEGPVAYDCGSLCGSACCSDLSFCGEDPYIYLLPGEKEYLDDAGSSIHIKRQNRREHDLPASWGEYVYIACCPGNVNCERAVRPIQCRTFPLYPYITEEGELEMRLCYMDLPYSCPFVEKRSVVSDDFYRAALKAWKMLIEDKAIRDLVILDSRNYDNRRDEHGSDIGDH